MLFFFRVNSLVWDSNSDILYIGGKFDTLDGVSITPGLACWSPSKGLVSFPGGGILKQGCDGSFAEVTTMAYDSNTKVIFEYLFCLFLIAEICCSICF